MDADLVDAHYNLGYAYVEQGSYDQAIPHLERAIAIAPNLKRAHYNLARAHRELGNLEAATHAVTETLRLDANYQRAHELANAIKQAHYNRGITYLSDERYSEAVTAFQNAITLDPDFTTARYNLGLTYLKMETYPRAVEALQKTITLDSNYKAAYHALALAYLGQQELGKARDAAREALKLDPNYQPAISLLEAIDPTFTPPETQTTTPPEPATQPATLPESDPSVNPQPAAKPRQETHYELGIAYRDSKMYTEAIAEFQKVIDLDPDFTAVHISLGEVYLETGQLDDAENAANAALRIDANFEPARQLLDAIRQIRSIQSTPPTGTLSNATDVKKHYERGEAFLNNKQYNEAAAAFKRAIKADPSFADAHYSLGVAYLEMGALDDAKTAAEEASKLKVDRQLVHELLTAIKRVKTSQRRRKLWKKGLSYAAVLGIIAIAAFFTIQIINTDGCRGSSKSDSQSKLVPPSPPAPPSLSIKASLSRDYLLAGRTVNLTLIIKNSGGTAHNVKTQLQPQSRDGLNYEIPAPIPEILKSNEKTIRIPITADRNIGNREESLKIELIGNNGVSLATTEYPLRILDTVR